MPQPEHSNFFLPQYQSALGTVVHATPLVEAIKRGIPNARIVVAASGLAAQVWKGNPKLEQLLPTVSPLQDLRAAVELLRRARLFDGNPYTTLLTTGNERTRITLAALLAGRSTRVGFAVHGALVYRHLQFDPALSQIENNLRLLSEVVVSLDPLAVEPRMYPHAASGFAEGVLAGVARPRIVLATQTSPTQHKSWPQERWVELAHALRQRFHAELVFVGTEAENEAIEAIRQGIGFATLSLAGRTTVQDLAAILERCDLGVMLDTGPLHVARAVGLPAVIVAPAWSPVHEWLPVRNPRYRILKNACFPPPAPPDYVISEVSVEEVLQASRELLSSARLADAAKERTPEN